MSRMTIKKPLFSKVLDSIETWNFYLKKCIIDICMGSRILLKNGAAFELQNFKYRKSGWFGPSVPYVFVVAKEWI
jgi:hypothetical protein